MGLIIWQSDEFDAARAPFTLSANQILHDDFERH
jgi:hypothetical protein